MSEGKVFYNKLIRDHVPEKMRNKGVSFETRTLSAEEFTRALRKKLLEEASGVENAKTKEELIEELADVLAVVNAIRENEEVTEDELNTALTKGTEKKGGFKDRVFLEWSADDGYTTNEQKG